jgi:beta-galactosidase
MSDKNCLRVISAALACAAVFGVSSCSSWAVKTDDASLRQQTLLDPDWKFHRGDVSSNEQVSAASYDDGQWQRVDLPHDYVLDGRYATNYARNHGYLPFEVAWYRKHFAIPQSDQGKILQLEFGGVFRDSQVWLNGKFLGRHPSGYTPFSYDITKAARYGEDNIVTVRVDPRQFEGWWYEGGGIYRHVYFNAMAPLHVAPYGTYVISEVPNGNQGAHAEAEITIQTTVANDGTEPANCNVVSEIFGPDGNLIETTKSTKVVAANGKDQVVQHTALKHPQLWSLEFPQLYDLRTTLWQNGQAVDSTKTTFGIRTIHYDADKGFFLNGQHVEIRGVANHQDFPGVGIAVPDSLQPWRVKQLKNMGCNAWRTAHNPPNESVLDACDRLGMMVMDENRHLGDSYVHHSPKGTGYTNLSDLATMIQRDRNHPSIIMWSMCNEEGLQGTPEGAKIFTAMMKVVHQYDETRPITSAMNNGWMKPGFTTVENLVGVNYSAQRYAEIHRAHPRLPMFGSETANNKTARGEYVEDRTNGWASSYNLTDKGWEPVASQQFMCGSFTWTGFDYKGEPNPFGWPDVSNNTGLMDSCGFPKDKYYYLESWWSNKPMVHLMPDTWNWPGKEGKAIRVIAFSNAKQVELFLNGKSLGIQTMPQNGHLEWQVPYQAGRLLAKGLTTGRVVATDTLETTGPAERLQLSVDRQILQAGADDTVVVPISVLDDRGRLVPNANNRVLFQLDGGGRILGVGNGNPSDHDTDRASERNAFNGHCIAVIQAGSHSGVLKLTATSPGLKSADITFQVR